MKKRLKQMLKCFDSLRVRVLALLILVNVIIIATLAYTTFAVFQNALIKEIGGTRSDVLSQIGERVRAVKDNANTISNLYYHDATLQKLLKSAQTNQDMIEATAWFSQLYQKHNMVFQRFDVPYVAVIALENGGGLCSVATTEDFDYMNPKNKIWYKKVYQGRGVPVDIANYRDDFFQSSHSVARAIFNDNDEPVAYLMINMDERKIYDTFKNVLSSEGNIYIVDPEGTVISSSIEHLRGFNLFSMSNLDKLFGESTYAITTIEDRSVLYSRYLEEETGITVLEEIPLSLLTKDIAAVGRVTVLISLAMVALACFWAWKFTSKMISPIEQLSEFMTTIQGEQIQHECHVSGYSEVNKLSDGLNRMLKRIGLLVEDVKRQENQRLRMELSFLQAQINPHFMYNTLFSIKCMVDMDKNTQASQMLTSYIALLRGSLSDPTEFITVENEFEQLAQYADIQRFRYTNHLEIILKYDDETQNKRIPKLLIQPLVENAIFHGIGGQGDHGCVIVLAKLLGDNLIISIEDNGIGISPECLNLLSHHTSQSAHIGIINVRERILLYFGSSYGLEIKSELGKGTKICLTLPVLE